MDSKLWGRISKIQIFIIGDEGQKLEFGDTAPIGAPIRFFF
jgi:hypothetical protein